MNAFSGGDKLLARLAEIAKKVSKPATLSVGFLEGATYPDGTSVPLVAAVQEFGSAAQGIPPRPYFRNMITAKAPGWGDATVKALEATDYDAEAALALMGEGIKGELQQSIIDTNEPPLSPRTIARKGSAKPLVETGHMLNSVDYVVEPAKS